MHVCDWEDLSWFISVNAYKGDGNLLLLCVLHFLHPHRIDFCVGSRAGSLVRAAAPHPFQMGGPFRLILPSTPTAAELMRWSRSSAHTKRMGTNLLPLWSRDKHVLQPVVLKCSTSNTKPQEKVIQSAPEMITTVKPNPTAETPFLRGKEMLLCTATNCSGWPLTAACSLSLISSPSSSSRGKLGVTDAL